MSSRLFIVSALLNRNDLDATAFRAAGSGTATLYASYTIRESADTRSNAGLLSERRYDIKLSTSRTSLEVYFSSGFRYSSIILIYREFMLSSSIIVIQKDFASRGGAGKEINAPILLFGCEITMFFVLISVHEFDIVG